MSVFVSLCVLFYSVCIAVLHNLLPDWWLEVRIRKFLRPATSAQVFWFPCAYKRMLRWFPRLQVATACFSCSPPDLNFLDPYFIFMYMHNNHCHWVTAHLQLNILLLLLFLMKFFKFISCSQGKRCKEVDKQWR